MYQINYRFKVYVKNKIFQKYDYSKRKTFCINIEHKYIKKVCITISKKSLAILVFLHSTCHFWLAFDQKSIEIEWIKHHEIRRGIQSTTPPHVHKIDLVHDMDILIEGISGKY